MKKLIISLAAILLFAVCASAQIEGRVTDEGGNGVANVTVTATNSEGEVVSTVTTDEDGHYIFEDLDAGKFKITATGAAGFQAAVHEDIDAAEEESTTLDIVLTRSGPATPSGPAPSDPPVGKGPDKVQTPRSQTNTPTFQFRVRIQGFSEPLFFKEVTGLGTEHSTARNRCDEFGGARPGLAKYGSVFFIGPIPSGVYDQLVNWIPGNLADAPNYRNLTVELLGDTRGNVMSWNLSNVFPATVTGESMLICHQGLAPLGK